MVGGLCEGTLTTMWFRGTRLDSRLTWALIPTLRHTSCVTLGKRSNLSEPHVLLLSDAGPGSTVVVIVHKASFPVLLGLISGLTAPFQLD